MSLLRSPFKYAFHTKFKLNKNVKHIKKKQTPTLQILTDNRAQKTDTLVKLILINTS